MKIEVGNDIVISNATDEIKEYCISNLVIDNPDYHTRKALGKYTGSIAEKIVLYQRLGDDYILPFGCLQDVWKMHKNIDDYSLNFSPIRAVSYNSDIETYDYQEKAIQSVLKAKNGILVMPCGSGKTICGLEIASRVGGRVLWLTHTADLLHQSMSAAKAAFDIDSSCFGTITDGISFVGTHITFSTVQTMCKLDLLFYRDYFDVVIVDECQRCCGSPTKVTQFYKVVSNLNARYKVGLTATPKRADGLEKSMFALLGGVIHEVSREDVADKTCPIQVHMIDTNFFPDIDDITNGDGTVNYSALIDCLTHDKERFRLVADTINELPAPVLVLGNRVDYLKRLNDEYIGKSICLSGMTKTKSNKEKRKQALKDLNDGKIDCAFCTYQLAAEGLDVPNLRHIVLATPEKDPTRIQQSCGRVGRKARGKRFGVVIDFVDDLGLYKSWANKRKSLYKKLGYDII